MASKATFLISAGLLLASIGCSSGQGANPEDSSTEPVVVQTEPVVVHVGEVSFVPFTKAPIDAFGLNSDLVVVARIDRVRSVAKVDVGDGTTAVTTVIDATVESTYKGAAREGAGISFVVPGGSIDDVQYRIEGAKNVSDFEEARSYLLFLSPVINGSRPVEASFRIEGDRILDSSSRDVGAVTELVTMMAEAAKLKEARMAAKPSDDALRATLDRICDEHMPSLLASKDAIAKAFADPAGLALVSKALAASSGFGASLRAVEPPAAIGDDAARRWTVLLDDLTTLETLAAKLMETVDSNSFVEQVPGFAVSASALESDLQGLGAGNCAGFGP